MDTHSHVIDINVGDGKEIAHDVHVGYGEDSTNVVVNVGDGEDITCSSCTEHREPQEWVAIDIDLNVAEVIGAGDGQANRAGSDHTNEKDGIKSCAVCSGPLKWVVIGRCGCRCVCSKCAVRYRYFNDDLRCQICLDYCHIVFITKAGREGRAYHYSRYHRGSKAYFDDEQQYKAMKSFCLGNAEDLSQQPQAWYKPLGCFVLYLIFFCLLGAGLGFSVAVGAKHRSGKVFALVLGATLAPLLASFCWCLNKRF